MKIRRGMISISIIAVLLASLLAPAVAYAGGPITPTSFYGEVTVNDIPVPVDTVITGTIVGAVGSPGEGSFTVTEPGKYGGPGGLESKLNIFTDSSRDVGKDIEFTVELPGWSQAKTAVPAAAATFDSEVHELGLTVAASSEAEILTYSIAGQVGDAVINSEDGTIAVVMPYGTDVTALVATFTTSADFQSIKVGEVNQITGVTENDFTGSVTYVVTAEDGTTKDWVVTVTVALSSEAEILTYSLAGQVGDAVINSEDGTIAVVMPYDTVVTALVATFTTSADIQSIKVGEVDQVTGVTENDFTGAVTYVVTAEDGTTKDWVVTVTVALSSEAEILTYSLAGWEGVIDSGPPGTIAVEVPYGTDVTALVATFTTSPDFQSIKVGEDDQVSGTTANDFTGAVTYVVTAQDGTIKEWVVTVTVEESDAAEILTYSIAGQVGDAVINSEDGTIAVVMPYDTVVTALVATFTTSADIQFIKVGEVDQVSGVTPNDFTVPVTYVVTAQDGTTIKEWVVTVTVEEPTDADKVAADKAALTDNAIKGDNADLNNVTMDLNLITEGTEYQSAISWESSDEAVNATDGGTVTRPAFGEGDAVVTLTATITQGTASDTKDFVVTVLEEEPTYDLTMVVAPEIGGTVTDVTNTSPYAEGAEVSIKAEAAAGYQFVNWTAPVGTLLDATQAVTTFTMPGQAATVTANFEPITYYTLDVTCDPTEGGSVILNPSQPEGGYEAGTTIELTATANEDYAFGNWSGDLSGSTNPDTITMDSAKSIAANFAQVSTPEDVSVTQVDPGVESITVTVVADLDVTEMPAGLDPQDAYLVAPVGTGNFTLSFTDVDNASDIRVYKVVDDGTWTLLDITVVGTTIEVTMDCADPILVFALPPATIGTIPLSEDWNLLSTPIKLDAESDSLEQILGGSVANIEASWRWDVQDQVWVIPTDYELSPLEAVYVKVSSNTSATAEFIPSGEISELPSRELQRGLNLIGPAPALEAGVFPDMPLDQALISVAGAGGGLTGYTMVVSPAHNQPGWAYYLGMDARDLLPFKGYWVVMENASTLYGSSTTPVPE